VFYAELNELLTRELAEHGYSGVEVRVTPMRTEIIIRATRTQNVLGEPLPLPRLLWLPLYSF
jgi:small subunit ribosomal protein S3e